MLHRCYETRLAFAQASQYTRATLATGGDDLSNQSHVNQTHVVTTRDSDNTYSVPTEFQGMRLQYEQPELPFEIRIAPERNFDVYNVSKPNKLFCETARFMVA